MQFQLHSGHVRATLLPHLVDYEISEDMMLVLDDRSGDLKCLPYSTAKISKAVTLLSLNSCSSLSCCSEAYARQELASRGTWADIQRHIESRLKAQGHAVRWLDAHLAPINPQAVRQWF